MCAHGHVAHERCFDKTTDSQSLLPEIFRLCFLCGFGPDLQRETGFDH
jgi:hypothetical protein